MKTDIKQISGNWDRGFVLDKHTLRSEYIGDNERGYPQFPALLGITKADDVNKSHPYTLSIVGEKLGFAGWNGANKLLQIIKDDRGVDLKATDNAYHCAVKVGKKDTSISRKYSDALVSLLENVRDEKDYKVKV